MQLTSCASGLLGARVGASVGGGGRTCARTDITDCEAVGPRKGISSMSGQGGDAGVPSEQRATAAVTRLWIIQMRALFVSNHVRTFFWRVCCGFVPKVSHPNQVEGASAPGTVNRNVGEERGLHVAWGRAGRICDSTKAEQTRKRECVCKN